MVQVTIWLDLEEVKTPGTKAALWRRAVWRGAPWSGVLWKRALWRGALGREHCVGEH